MKSRIFGIDMMKNIVFAVALAATAFIASCADESNNPDDITGKTNQEVFMMRTWKSVSFTDSSSEGIIETMNACDKDDTYTFTSTSKCLWKANGKCNTEPDQDEISWSMTSPDAKYVKFLYDYDWYIEKMTGTDIVLRYYYQTHQGDINTWKVTLVNN
jgi:hypothetical protein